MDAKKVTEMEMKEHTPAEVHDDEDAEKDKMERIRGKKKKTTHKKQLALTAFCTLQMIIW